LARWLKQRRVLWILLARFLFDPVFYFYMFWIPQYLARERGMSVNQIGSRLWIPFLVLGISQVLGGRVSDVLVKRGWEPIKARVSVLTVAACLTPASWLAALTGSADGAIALMCVLMFAHGFWITNFLGLLGDMFPGGAIGTITGLTGTAGGVGGMLSTLVIGAIVDRFSFLPVFVASGILYPLALSALFIAIRQKSSPDAARF
jgi:ACS family hexuronate transporter-like MFS transporter